ncbi:MAG: hypothetical protein A3A30_04905 [Candidatus Terrybacteria bacterium RIFCSPLOWO2_01_FULL_48_14]|nr:MAG: hypothetical protein A3A30_04905 [Candidatus Terrybacteria bacterium RIFCSPLOWO2_01_FULL_48_14]
MRTNRSGLTLVEMLITIGLGVTIAAIVGSIAISGIVHIRTVKRQERLYSNAAHVSDTLAYWVRQAEALNVISPTELVMTFPDSTQKTFLKDGTRIMFDGVALTEDNSEVTNLSFVALPVSVQVSATLRYAGSDEEISFSTAAARRNN